MTNSTHKVTVSHQTSRAAARFCLPLKSPLQQFRHYKNDLWLALSRHNVKKCQHATTANGVRFVLNLKGRAVCESDSNRHDKLHDSRTQPAARYPKKKLLVFTPTQKAAALNSNQNEKLCFKHATKPSAWGSQLPAVERGSAFSTIQLVLGDINEVCSKLRNILLPVDAPVLWLCSPETLYATEVRSNLKCV